VIGLIVFSVIVLKNTLDRSKYYLDKSARRLEYGEGKALTFGDIADSMVRINLGLQKIGIKNDSQLNCRENMFYVGESYWINGVPYNRVIMAYEMTEYNNGFASCLDGTCFCTLYLGQARDVLNRTIKDVLTSEEFRDKPFYFPNPGDERMGYVKLYFFVTNITDDTHIIMTRI
jgi:hypothetical protein